MFAIPFINYSKKLLNDHAKLSELLLTSAQESEFILKKNVLELENTLKNQLKMPYAYAVSNGTYALYLSLIALGVGKGDEVITPAFSYISTASTIAQVGATPVFVDVEPHDYLMNVDAVAAKITSKTKAIMAVHLFSALADMPALQQLTKQHNLFLLEDSAVVLGGKIKGVPTGTWGDIGIFSFFPAKPLGGVGDGGLVVTRDKDFAKNIFQLRNHGQDGKTRFLHHYCGFNSRMDEINAGYLLHRLSRFTESANRRCEIAHFYHRELQKFAPNVQVQQYDPDTSANYAYVIRVQRRSELIKYLINAGIETKIYYPEALPFQPAFHYLNHARGDFPQAELLAKEALALPMCDTLTDLQLQLIIQAIGKFYAK